jgi:hypothetical protein
MVKYICSGRPFLALALTGWEILDEFTPRIFANICTGARNVCRPLVAFDIAFLLAGNRWPYERGGTEEGLMKGLFTKGWAP